MNVGNIPHPSFPTYGFAITASSSGRTSLPVAPGQVIYSHFKHVTGTPAPEGTAGVNISKLKILDSLIEQLSKIKKQAADMDIANETDENRINALIDQYQKQLQATQATAVYSPISPAVGTLFNIAV